jgi:hypothetical protein
MSCSPRCVATAAAGARPSTYPPSADPEAPREVALDDRGNALAIWELTPLRASIDTTIAQSATRAANGSWSRPVNISAAGTHASRPVLAVDQRGGAVAAWSSTTRDTAIVQSADRAPAGAWRKPIDISAREPGTYATGVDLAIDARGNAVAAWHLTLPNPSEDDEEPPVIVQGAVRRAGATWQPRSLRGADNVQGPVRVAIDPRGDMVAIWQRLDPSGYIVVRATGP